MQSFLRFPVLDVTTDLMLAAAATCQRFGVSYWDAANPRSGPLARL